MKKLIPLIILVIAALAYTQFFLGFEFEGGKIDIPGDFEGPIVQNMGKSKVYGFKKTHGNSNFGTLLQISVLDPGTKFPTVSSGKQKEWTEKYLLQMLSGVERKRTGFQKGRVRRISIGGVPAAKVYWEGYLRGDRMEGMMYCYIYDSKIIVLHTQDLKKYKREFISQATDAFENIRI